MVQECGHLPLAISVIGGILRQKQQKSEWEEVSRNMDAYLKNGGDGIGDDKQVKPVLDLSFNALPYYLKPCFLYLACFPEDQDIDIEKLYRLWLAEGLITSEKKGKNESFLDVAERYLTELALRCMVQVEKGYFNNPRRKFASCRLHDLMRDLCLSKAEEIKFFKRFDISETQHDIPLVIDASIHRLAINLTGEPATLSKKCLQEVKDLRSCLILCKEDCLMRTAKDPDNIVNFENSKHLRILVLDGVEFRGGKNPIPGGIGKLIHLKYLSFFKCDLKYSGIFNLPEDVCYLPFLQTLDFRVYSYREFRVPNLIWNLKSLRHLFLPLRLEVIGGGKLKLAGLNELESLEGIDSRSASIVDVVNLVKLRKLRAVICEEDVDILSKIVDFMRFQLHEADLQFLNCDLTNVFENIFVMRSLVRLRICKSEIGSFPRYRQDMSQNLVKLEISFVEIGVDMIEAIGKYPMLEYLCFKRVLGLETTEMRLCENSFLELKELHFDDLPGLHKWKVEKGAMPKLKKLNIDYCNNLKKLPNGLRFISTLETLNCNGVSEELKGRLRRGGENGEGGGQDYVNFSHIPNITIR